MQHTLAALQLEAVDAAVLVLQHPGHMIILGEQQVKPAEAASADVEQPLVHKLQGCCGPAYAS